MSRTKPTDVEMYRRDIRSLIRKNMETNGIRTNKELAEKICMPEATLNYRLRNPETFKLGEMHRIRLILRIPEEERGKVI